MASVQPSDAEVAQAIARTGHVYTDPVDNPRVASVAALTPDVVLAVPPPTWGLEPTQRDQAAIDAGNA